MEFDGWVVNSLADQSDTKALAEQPTKLALFGFCL